MLTSIIITREFSVIFKSCKVQTTSSRLYVATFRPKKTGSLSSSNKSESAWCCLYFAWLENNTEFSCYYNTGQHHTGAKKVVQSHVLICNTIPSGSLHRDCYGPLVCCWVPELFIVSSPQHFSLPSWVPCQEKSFTPHFFVNSIFSFPSSSSSFNVGRNVFDTEGR